MLFRFSPRLFLCLLGLLTLETGILKSLTTIVGLSVSAMFLALFIIKLVQFHYEDHDYYLVHCIF